MRHLPIIGIMNNAIVIVYLFVRHHYFYSANVAVGRFPSRTFAIFFSVRNFQSVVLISIRCGIVHIGHRYHKEVWLIGRLNGDSIMRRGHVLNGNSVWAHRIEMTNT